MIATLAMIGALLFVGVALSRLLPAAPHVLGHIALATALAAGGLGGAYWHAGADSRWLVGALLFFLAVPVSAFAAASRPLRIAAAVLGILGFALFAIARATAV